MGGGGGNGQVLLVLQDTRSNVLLWLFGTRWPCPVVVSSIITASKPDPDRKCSTKTINQPSMKNLKILFEQIIAMFGAGCFGKKQGADDGRFILCRQPLNNLNVFLWLGNEGLQNMEKQNKFWTLSNTCFRYFPICWLFSPIPNRSPSQMLISLRNNRSKLKNQTVHKALSKTCHWTGDQRLTHLH